MKQMIKHSGNPQLLQTFLILERLTSWSIGVTNGRYAAWYDKEHIIATSEVSYIPDGDGLILNTFIADTHPFLNSQGRPTTQLRLLGIDAAERAQAIDVIPTWADVTLLAKLLCSAIPSGARRLGYSNQSCKSLKNSNQCPNPAQIPEV